MPPLRTKPFNIKNLNMAKYLALNDKNFGILRSLYVEWFGPERGALPSDDKQSYIYINIRTLKIVY